MYRAHVSGACIAASDRYADRSAPHRRKRDGIALAARSSCRRARRVRERLSLRVNEDRRFATCYMGISGMAQESALPNSAAAQHGKRRMIQKTPARVQTKVETLFVMQACSLPYHS